MSFRLLAHVVCYRLSLEKQLRRMLHARLPAATWFVHPRRLLSVSDPRLKSTLTAFAVPLAKPSPMVSRHHIFELQSSFCMHTKLQDASDKSR